MNDVELIQQFAIKYINKLVREHFSDTEDIGDDVIGSSTARQIGKKICIHKDNDPITLTTARMAIFNFFMQEREELTYSIPITTFQESFVYLPQVILHFRELFSSANANNRQPVRARVGFRIKDDNFTMTEANQLATRIKNEFATPRLFFKKGRTKFSYRDKSKGYELIIAAFDEANAEKLIRAVLSVNNHTYDESILTDSESRKNWSAVETKNILGKTYKLPQKRPVADVYFTHAELKIWGMPKDVILVDTTGFYKDALEIVGF